MMGLKRLSAFLPERWQIELKRIHYRRQIVNDQFATREPEFELLSQFVSSGDWVIDVGANIGKYTKRFSELVGASGRVIACEPVPRTFSLLAANVQLFGCSNVTLVNVAVSNKTAVIGMSIPRFSTGLANYYQARVADANAEFSVMTLPLDAFGFNARIAMVKIDTEGHEAFVLRGMTDILKRWRPCLLIETDSVDMPVELSALNYSASRLPRSPNVIFTPL